MGLNRRGFLTAALGAACSAAAHPWLTPMAFAEVPGDARLVVIVLRGAMDGLDLVRPVAAPQLAALRPDLLGLPGADPVGLDLGRGFALHPGLDGLAGMWQAGGLGFAHAVSTPYRDKRSHFVGQDILEAGTPGLPLPRDGWLNRLLQVVPGARGETAFSIGTDSPAILAGPAAHSSWSPGTALELSAQARLLLEQVYAPDADFAEAARLAFRISDSPESQGGTGKGAAALADFAAAQLKKATRIATFSITGWDTHRGQTRSIGRPLAELQTALLHLQAGLGPVWGQTMVLALTEFGRTVRQNGSTGTDHGTGGALVMAGGALRGGQVFGRWPGLAEGDLYEDRDLMPTADVRGYAAQALHGLFGIERQALERVVFPGLDMAGLPEVVL